MRLRRTNIDLRLDMTPLIDVVFLLLTFFIFALVLMVRADVLDITLPKVGTGASARQANAVIVTLTADGSILVDREATTPADVGERVRALVAERDDAVVMLEADARAASGRLIELADALVAAGVREFSVIGMPAGGAEPRTPGSGSNPDAPAAEE
ncbi:MAG: biopolymer transporter ExbD [Phycisphaeraceae bacterium]|nr:MAG: biopolymer transporter ExbD [Phycisphaeraceae bacterium]